MPGILLDIRDDDKTINLDEQPAGLDESKWQK